MVTCVILQGSYHTLVLFILEVIIHKFTSPTQRLSSDSELANVFSVTIFIIVRFISCVGMTWNRQFDSLFKVFHYNIEPFLVYIVGKFTEPGQ